MAVTLTISNLYDFSIDFLSTTPHRMSMAYRIEKHIGDAVYVYEATSAWDADKKQPRQTRTYLGKLDPQTGEVIPPRQRSTPRHAKDYGNWYLLSQVATKLGLPALLQHVFLDDASVLLALAVFEISEAAPLYLFPNTRDLRKCPSFGGRGGRQYTHHHVFFERRQEHKKGMVASSGFFHTA